MPVLGEQFGQAPVEHHVRAAERGRVDQRPKTQNPADVGQQQQQQGQVPNNF